MLPVKFLLYYRSADLASIHSDEESDWIVTHLPNKAENRVFWIGLIKTNDGKTTIYFIRLTVLCYSFLIYFIFFWDMVRWVAIH